MIDVNLLKKYYNGRRYHDHGYIKGESIWRFIHPNKRDLVQYIVKNVPDDVDMIIVFGSTTDDTHNVWSDLDLAIVSKEDSFSTRRIIKEFGPYEEVDVIDFRSFEDIVKQAPENMYQVEQDMLDRGVPMFVRNIPHKIEIL